MVTPAMPAPAFDPVLLDVPDSFDTERLTLRVPRAGDGPAIHAAVIDSLETLRPWMPFAQKAPTIEESEATCRKAYAKFLLREDLTLRIHLKGSREVIGSTGLHHVNWPVRKCEIGYWVGRRHEGRGYASEAVRGLVRFASQRLGFRRLEVRCDARNERSRLVAERCGFQLEALMRDACLDVQGEVRDECVYVLFPQRAS